MAKSEILEVTALIAEEVTLLCPHCQVKQGGFFSNPQGGTFKCDDCGTAYKVHPEADIDIQN
ncbi:MAG: hypothetical protein HRU38_23435 [Saccharospirillaceae bacterium]|nr:hypothetical protein [Saccharospirillaceae bacterium]